MVKTVLLDFAGTIVDGEFDRRCARRRVARFLRAQGYLVSDTEYTQAMKKALESVKAGWATLRETTSEELHSKTLNALGIPTTPSLIGEIELLEQACYTWRIEDDTRALLEQLKASFKLGLVSNSMSESPRLVLREASLDHLFSVVVLSRDIGYRKPHSKIFNEALRRLGSLPKDSVYVGDNINTDILGAKKVGMKTVLVQRDPTIKDRGSTPDATVSNLKLLPRTLPRIWSEET